MREEPNQNKEPRIMQLARAAAERLFNSFPAEQRTAQAMSALQRILDDEWLKKELPDIDSHTIQSELDAIAHSPDVYSYAEASLKIIDPILQLAVSHPEEFAQMRRRTSSINMFEPVNELLRYGIDGDELHIHIADAWDMDNEKKFFLFTQGLRELAQIVANDKDIKVITATSPIVAEYPGTLQYFGFTIEGPVNEQVRLKYFPLESRPISWASISKKRFLELYPPEGK